MSRYHRWDTYILGYLERGICCSKGNQKRILNFLTNQLVLREMQGERIVSASRRHSLYYGICPELPNMDIAGPEKEGSLSERVHVCMDYSKMLIKLPGTISLLRLAGFSTFGLHESRHLPQQSAIASHSRTTKSWARRSAEHQCFRKSSASNFMI